MAKRFLLTGASGFLGKRLVKEILINNNKLSIIIREGTDTSFIDRNTYSVNFYNVDVKSISDIVQECKPQYVIHCAVAYGRNESIKKVFKTNLDLFVELLHSSIQANVLHFINTDTFSGKDGSYDYLKPYHLSKRHAVEWAKLLVEESKMKFSNLRLEHIYGPNDNTDKFFPKMLELLSNNVAKIDLTEGNQRRDFIFIDDVTRAYIDVIENQESNFCEYEVGTGVSTSIKELLQLMKSLINNCSTNLNFGALPTRKGEFAESVADISSLNELGWQPRVNIREGVNKIIHAD